jgi:acetyl-CoA carboxylase biotin carboxyl carrier protein
VALSADDIKTLIAEFQSSDWEEMALTVGDLSLVISRSGNSLWMPGSMPRPAPAETGGPMPARGPIAEPVTTTANPVPRPAQADQGSSPPTASPVSPPPDGKVVTSPTVGLFWRSPGPGAAPYVEVGHHVEADDVVCIIEVMKLMHHVQAGITGTVAAIEPENGGMVEHGTVIMRIIPDA